MSESETKTPAPVERRGFLTSVWAVLVGGVVSLAPVVIGLVPFLSAAKPKQRDTPNARDSGGSGRDGEGFIDVGAVASLDETPRLFPVMAERFDAWTYYPGETIGSIYVRKQESGDVWACNVICPHAGCAVDFQSANNKFHCPCHDSSFTIEGERSGDSPSARDLDTLDSKIDDGRVLVKFENYRTGTAEKIPEA